MGIGDWGLGIGDWAQSPIPNPQSPIPKNIFFFTLKILFNFLNNYLESYNYKTRAKELIIKLLN